MVLVVTGVGSLIHVYSTGYMKDDESFARFFAYLNLFLFFMLLLVLGRSLLVLFVGWEGVGLASYLLIGFWFEDPEKAAAGKKAFITNRVGDAGFLLGMFLLFFAVGTLDMDRINAAFAGGVPAGVSASLIGVLLFIGATGKSAQIPLHVWLPDAMAGPTPVSALIHAATMVTAGVYLIARLSGIFLHAEFASQLIATIGVLTAFFAATIAVVQTDIKRVLAYSTISQLGFMFSPPASAPTAWRCSTCHARLLQGLPVPRRRQRDPRHERRAGHPQDGRPGEEDPDHLRHLRHLPPRRSPGCRRCRASSPRTRSSGTPTAARSAARLAAGAGLGHRADDRLLHVPPAVADVLRLPAHGRGGGAPRARIAVVDDRRAGRAGGAGGDRRLLLDTALPRADAAAAGDPAGGAGIPHAADLDRGGARRRRAAAGGVLLRQRRGAGRD
jgi:hypothetical protein